MTKGRSTDLDQGEVDPSKAWRMLADLVRPDAVRWTGLGLFISAGACLMLLGPLIITRIVERSIAGAGRSELAQLAMAFIAVAVVVQAWNVIGVWLASKMAWRTTNDIRLRLVRHVLGLDHEFHRTHTPGELIQRVDGDVTSISDFLSQVVPRAVSSLVVVGGALAILMFIDWRLGVAVFAYLLVIAAIVVYTRSRAITQVADEMGQTAKMYGGIEEQLSASEDLRANGAGAYALHRFVENSTDVIRSRVASERAVLSMWVLVQGAFVLGDAVALVLSAMLVSRGSLEIGAAVLLFQYLRMMAAPLEDIIDRLEVVQKAGGAILRVSDLGSVSSTIVDLGTTSPPAGALSVEVKGVSFDYGDDQPVLDHVDLRIEAGRSVGVVGRTGSGKTTYSRLVLRLTEALEGDVLLGGVPIGDISLSELRRRVCLVPQEVELFSGSIRDNITLFDGDASDADVEDALRSVGLESLADSGIHRTLGSGGEGLSSGEAQLLALARVWLRQPDLIVLDEATARVDPETEARIDAAVSALRQGRTTIVIAHRLSTLETVDEIAVFGDGRIVESGRRADLLEDATSRFSGLVELAKESS